jgi:hypothetical protein
MLFRVDGKFATDYSADSHYKRDSNKIRRALGALSDIPHVFLKSRRQQFVMSGHDPGHPTREWFWQDAWVQV